MKWLLILVAICSLSLILVPAQADKGGQGKDKGSAGGKGYADTACVTYIDTDPEFPGLVSDNYDSLPDGYDKYIHGVDGQVTVLSRFIHMLGKHNEHDRYLDVFPNCDGGGCFDSKSFEIRMLWTYRAAKLDGNPVPGNDRVPTGEVELNLREMNYQQVARTTMGFNLGEKRRLLFGHDLFFGPSHACGTYGTDTPSGPAWVTCDYLAEDGGCGGWTISTISPIDPHDSVVGCMISFEKGQPTVHSYHVQADFTIYLDYDDPGLDDDCLPE